MCPQERNACFVQYGQQTHRNEREVMEEVLAERPLGFAWWHLCAPGHLPDRMATRAQMGASHSRACTHDVTDYVHLSYLGVTLVWHLSCWHRIRNQLWAGPSTVPPSELPRG